MPEPEMADDLATRVLDVAFHDNQIIELVRRLHDIRGQRLARRIHELRKCDIIILEHSLDEAPKRGEVVVRDVGGADQGDKVCLMLRRFVHARREQARLIGHEQCAP